MSSLEGVLVADKPAGPTSHDIVADLRRFTGSLRVGHTGTLDPFATGVLPLCIGRATRLSRFLSSGRKLYSGLIHLGVTTDTYDPDGREVSRRPCDAVTAEAVRWAAALLEGPIMQTPPTYSARKVGGRPLHRLARQGVVAIRRPSPIVVYRFSILSVAIPQVRFEAETSTGTYVRSLAHDLGETLGCGAHLAELRRLASGSLTIEGAHSREEIRSRAGEGRLSEIILPLRHLDLGLPTVTLTREGATAMQRGAALRSTHLARPLEPGPTPGPVRVLDETGDLLGVAVPAAETRDDEVLRPHVVLARALG